MSAILKPKLQQARISADERARRKAAIDFGRGSVRLEGFVMSAEVEKLSGQYIEGAMTMEELMRAVKALAPRQAAGSL